MGYEQVKAIVDNPLQMTIPTMIKVETPALYKLTDLAIFETSESPGFITSDHPCVWYDPEWYKRSLMLQTPALMYDTIEITLPISPRQIIVLNRKRIKVIFPRKSGHNEELVLG